MAKQRDSRYESGVRSGAWQKMRVNQRQEFVIGGYTPSAKNLDTIVFGYYDGERLIYSGRTRNGFTPSSRDQLFKRLKPLAVDQCPCPFANLPEARSGRVGRGADRREDEGVPVGEAGAGRAVRVLGVDAGRASEAPAVHGAAGGEGAAGSDAGVANWMVKRPISRTKVSMTFSRSKRDQPGRRRTLGVPSSLLAIPRHAGGTKGSQQSVNTARQGRGMCPIPRLRTLFRLFFERGRIRAFLGGATGPTRLDTPN